MSGQYPLANDESASREMRRPAFVTTHWSLVAAADGADSSQAQAAIERLCRSYWYPLYAYVRRRGYSVDDAQDMTQAFFARVIERHWVADADRRRGRFRTFLLTALNRFLADEWDKVRARKRGGGVEHVPIQIDNAETRYGCEPADHRTPEQYFERRWALTLLDTVLERLRAEYERDGKARLFAALHPMLGGGEVRPYDEVAAGVGISEGAVKVTAHRMRQRYRRLLREEIAQTSAQGANVDEELDHLFATLSGN